MMIYVLIVCVLVAGASAAEPVKGVFESCPACKLDSMPELKRFFHESVLKGEYGDKLSVKFIPGATPQLILYAADGSQVSREDVSDKLKYDELHKWVQKKGFKKAATAAKKAPVSSANSQSSKQSNPAPHPDAASTNTAAAAAGRGKRQHQRPRDGPAGPLQRRRRLNPAARGQGQQGAAAAAAGGEGGMRRRRRKRAAVKGGKGAGGGGGGAAAGGGGPGGQARVRRRRRRAAAAGPGAT